jgi:ribonuclease-3
MQKTKRNKLLDAEYNIGLFEERIGYNFNNKDLLVEALTHKSFYHEHPDRVKGYNERLEFLGDSVLGLIIVDYLFSLPDKLPESTMAKIKSYLVKESILSEIAKSLSIGKFLRLGKGEEITGGRGKRSLLANAVEAIIGAIYIDGGFDVVKGMVIDNLFKDKIKTVIDSLEFQDFKTELQELSQHIYGVIPTYRLLKEEGKEHEKLFTIEVYIGDELCGVGMGKNKKEAESQAAREALLRLKNIGKS